MHEFDSFTEEDALFWADASWMDRAVDAGFRDVEHTAKHDGLAWVVGCRMSSGGRQWTYNIETESVGVYTDVLMIFVVSASLSLDR